MKQSNQLHVYKVNDNLNDVTDKISYIMIRIRMFLYNYITFDKNYFPI